jgi:uncharacterized membrane protein
MAPTYVSAAVAVLVNVFALLGIQVGSEELTTTITTVVTIISGFVIMYRQVTTGRSTVFGAKK